MMVCVPLIILIWARRLDDRSHRFAQSGGCGIAFIGPKDLTHELSRALVGSLAFVGTMLGYMASCALTRPD